MVLRVTAQRARIAVRLAAALRFALVWFFVAVRQHVAISGQGKMATTTKYDWFKSAREIYKNTMANTTPILTGDPAA